MKTFLSILLLIFILGSATAQEIPYKNSDEFELFTSFHLVKEQPEKRPDYVVTPVKKYDPTPQMYLYATLKILKVNENEASLRAYTAENLLKYKKKMKEGLELQFDFGNFESIKKREIPHLFTIFILDKSKTKIGKIEIEVLENGAIFVNGRPHGKK